MAKTPKESEKDNAPAVSGGDILPENQQPEQAAIPPFEPNAPPPEMSSEETAASMVDTPWRNRTRTPGRSGKSR